jgi:hypothetical protein
MTVLCLIKIRHSAQSMCMSSALLRIYYVVKFAEYYARTVFSYFRQFRQ